MNALIFDMDGVIVDSELQWQKEEGNFFRELVPKWSDEDHHKIVGMAVLDLFHWLQKEYSITMGRDEFLARCDHMARTIYGERTTLTPGFRELYADAKAAGIPVGLASSSPRAWIQLTMDRFGLTFQASASADDVPPGRTKPHPHLYLLALKGLGAPPKGSLAIEDSVPGVKAAKDAGMHCAALRNGSNDSQDLSLADFELKGLRGVDAAALRRRLKALSLSQG